MKSRKSPCAILVAASIAGGFMSPPTALAYGVTRANGRSTFNAVTQWAAEVGYAVIWQPRTVTGMVDFVAPPREVHKDFRIAVKGLVSGAVYGRTNVYCIPPSEVQADAIIDDRMRLVYVVGRPTGRRCRSPSHIHKLGNRLEDNCSHSVRCSNMSLYAPLR
ncbi:hypothetical protein [Cupriavidus sp. CP313]